MSSGNLVIPTARCWASGIRCTLKNRKPEYPMKKRYAKVPSFSQEEQEAAVRHYLKHGRNFLKNRQGLGISQQGDTPAVVQRPCARQVQETQRRHKICSWAESRYHGSVTYKGNQRQRSYQSGFTQRETPASPTRRSKTLCLKQKTNMPQAAKKNSSRRSSP